MALGVLVRQGPAGRSRSTVLWSGYSSGAMISALCLRPIPLPPWDNEDEDSDRSAHGWRVLEKGLDG